METIQSSQLNPGFRDRVAGLVKNYDFSQCLACGMCTGGCPYSDIHENNDPRKFLRKINLGMEKEVFEDPFIWYCTMCERCTIECPMQVNIAVVVRSLRGTWDKDKIPGYMQTIAREHIESGNQMNVSQVDYEETLEWIQDELREELGDPDYTIPLDKKGAKYFYGFNARDVKIYANELQTTLKLFYAAGIDYTISTRRWDATNIALFTGQNDDFNAISQPIWEEFVNLGCEQFIVTECGHAFRSMKWGQRTFWKGEMFPIRHILELLLDLVKDGSLKLDPDAVTEVVTYHDPCNTARKEGVWQSPRELIRTFVKNFVDMNPNGRWNYCCGAGGGGMAMPEFNEKRKAKGRRKVDQVCATGAQIVIVPCHNCMDQFNDLNKWYPDTKGKSKNVHMCALMERALIMPEKK
ncbi:MAG: (Fe-S)-binding protein [Peptococcaceae bacterium]|jgi:Fe-S oxidoreductase|nr:(Fe-S)-binding protein [Peptococcaceae bacterium]